VLLFTSTLKLVLKANHFNTIRVGIASMKKRHKKPIEEPTSKRFRKTVPVPFTDDQTTSQASCKQAQANKH
jgi:hypothetical protein